MGVARFLLMVVEARGVRSSRAGSSLPAFTTATQACAPSLSPSAFGLRASPRTSAVTARVGTDVTWKSRGGPGGCPSKIDAVLEKVGAFLVLVVTVSSGSGLVVAVPGGGGTGVVQKLALFPSPDPRFILC